MTDKKIIITIVTVVYNGVNEIENTILSVINQTYNEIEYIVIDGASKDGTVDIIKKYADKITLWISEPDKGIYDAMNKAIDKSSGDWILFMNAGDFFYSDNSIEQVFTPDCDDYKAYNVVYGDAQFRLKSFSYIMEAMESTPSRFMPFSHQAAFTRVAVAKANQFDTTYKIAADTAFFMKLIRNGSVFKRVPVIVCSYDAQKGMSAQNEVKRSKELVNMQIKDGATYTPYYRKFIRDAYIKQFLRCLLPHCLWTKMRENKIKKQLGIK